MSDSEQIEIARYQREIMEDLRHMLGKYVHIMEWDVPDVEEVDPGGLSCRPWRLLWPGLSKSNPKCPTGADAQAPVGGPTACL
jgi:hypothetical protein